MNSIGKTIQCLRKAKGVTQEKMAQQIGVSFQAISKWENESTMPDIMMLPALADYFGVSIDELFQYKWNALTSKERLISFMLKNDILCVQNEEPGRPFEYFINTERFTTNMQISATQLSTFINVASTESAASACTCKLTASALIPRCSINKVSTFPAICTGESPSGTCTEI